MTLDFKEIAEGFMVTIAYVKQKTSSTVQNEGVNDLLKLIGKTQGMRMPYYASTMNIPEKTIEHWLKQLREEGKIEFKGAPKTGGYYVIEEK